MARRETLAFNVDAIRDRLWRRTAVPDGLLQKTFTRLDEQLDATRVKHFTDKGRVVSKRTYVDNIARLQAIDKVLSVVGAYHKEAETKQMGTAVALEIDPQTGRYKIIVGAATQGAIAPPEREAADEVIIQEQTKPKVGMLAVIRDPTANVLDESPQVINMRTRLKSKTELYRDMFKDE